MRLVPPESPARRADVFVGLLVGAWTFRSLVESLWWLAADAPFCPVSETLVEAAGLSFVLLASANACQGMILGRLSGFRWMALLMVVLGLQAVTHAFLSSGLIGVRGVAQDVLMPTILVYSLVRLRALRTAPKGSRAFR